MHGWRVGFISVRTGVAGNARLRAPRLRVGRLRAGMARLRADRAGGVLMEFAFVGPPFIALLIAILHTSLIFLAQEGLETAAESAARLMATGKAQNAGYTQAQFQTQVGNMLPPFLARDRLYVDVSTASSYSTATTAAPTFTYNSQGKVSNGFAYTPGAQGAIVVLRLMYLWPTATGPLGFSLVNQQGNNRMLLATSVLKSEGYTAAAA